MVTPAQKKLPAMKTHRINFVIGFLSATALWQSAVTLHAAIPLVTLETVPIGNINNPLDPTDNLGAVSYPYVIGKYDVTVNQYVAFLNAVAKIPKNPAVTVLWKKSMQFPLPYVSPGLISRTGTGLVASPYVYAEMHDSNLGANSGNRPICDISWFSAARFANWMHNGATNGADTEHGAYTLAGHTTVTGQTIGVIQKNPGAKWWIPTENEWYKAAYYDPSFWDTNTAGYGGYHDYPTMSDEPNIPVPEPPPGGTNSANFSGVMTDGLKLTAVGAYSNTHSYYGAYDMAGLLWEWTDGITSDSNAHPANRIMRGGSWSLGLLTVHRFSPRDYPPDYDDDDSGFRLSGLPPAP